MTVANSEYIYVTYIKTTPKKLWVTLTKPEFMKQYWYGMHIKTDWEKGSSWQLIFADGSVADKGTIAAIDPPLRLVLKWRNEWKSEFKAEGYSRCSIEIEPQGDVVKLTVTHSMPRSKSKLIKAISGGWPMILSNLKSLLETGKVIMKKKM